MKQNTKILLIALALGLLSSLADAQKLPSKVTIILTWQQFLSLDSALNVAYTWQDSKTQTNAVAKRFEPLYIQVQKQVADSAKVKKP